jgi:hypothetical protein
MPPRANERLSDSDSKVYYDAEVLAAVNWLLVTDQIPLMLPPAPMNKAVEAIATNAMRLRSVASYWILSRHGSAPERTPMMPRCVVSSSFPMLLDTMTLQMALIGYEAERQKIQDKIAELQRQPNGRAGRAAPTVAAIPAERGSRRMSAAARRRIAEAQKKRWAAYRRKQKAA